MGAILFKVSWALLGSLVSFYLKDDFGIYDTCRGLLGALSLSLMSTTLLIASTVLPSCILLVHFLVVVAMVVERARGEFTKHVRISSVLYVGGRRLLVGLFVFGDTALLPLINSAVAVLVREQRVLGPASGLGLALPGSGFLESSKQHIVQLWDCCNTTNKISAMSFFTTHNKRLVSLLNFLDVSTLVTSVASMAWSWTNGFLKNVPLRKIFVATTCNWYSSWDDSDSLVISEKWFAIGDSFILKTGSLVRFLSCTVLVLAAKLCPEGHGSHTFCNPYVHFKWRECSWRADRCWFCLSLFGYNASFATPRALPYPMTGPMPIQKESTDIEMKSQLNSDGNFLIIQCGGTLHISFPLWTDP
ncbi:LOW QUALITY PROTEIN: hypothetical protein NC652_024370 [Populus alba x Populus x berolinensis]|nr:LOW QUALITY PROTEIN: hypothetical protein NC652_024370 [Populus alba x Populus x berolinensis]